MADCNNLFSSIDSNNKAKIDQKKIDKSAASYNDAVTNAQNRAPTGNTIQNTTIALSKTNGKNQTYRKVAVKGDSGVMSVEIYKV